jgi:hypothetical protein
MALGVHLPGEQNVIFNADQGVTEALQRAENSRSSLIAYFEANADNIIGSGRKPARDTFYMEFPEYFTLTPLKKMEAMPEKLFYKSLTFCQPFQWEEILYQNLTECCQRCHLI